MAKGKKATPRVVRTREPRTEREKKFCDRWLLHRDLRQAYIEAGYSAKTTLAQMRNTLRTFAPYLTEQKKVVDATAAQELGLERADILHLFATVARVNAKDYVAREEVYDEILKTSIGRSRLKKLDELTREQAYAIDEVYINERGMVAYKLPTVTTKLKALTKLGEHHKLFDPEVKPQVNNHLHLNGLTMEQLIEMENAFHRLLGPRAVEVFGMTAEDQNEPTPAVG